MSPIKSPRRAFLRRYRGDRSGAIAVEFALLVPAMLTLYLGTFEVTQGLALDRLVKLNASTVTNLVAQYTTISASTDMPDIFKASSQVLAPYPSTSATVVVTCITIDAKGAATVAWSQAQNGKPKTVGQPIDVPAALKKPNTTLIFGETSMPYASPIQFIPMGTWQLYGSTYMFPRASSTVNLTT